MPKIRVEIEVPDDKYCTRCEYFKYIAYDMGGLYSVRFCDTTTSV